VEESGKKWKMLYSKGEEEDADGGVPPLPGREESPDYPIFLAPTVKERRWGIYPYPGIG